jgi:hypothetical protein
MTGSSALAWTNRVRTPLWVRFPDGLSIAWWLLTGPSSIQHDHARGNSPTAVDLSGFAERSRDRKTSLSILMRFL